MGKILTRDTILAADDLPVVEVEIREWPVDGEPGIILLKTLTGLERNRFEGEIMGPKRDGMNLDRIREKLLQKCIVGEDKKPMFKGDEGIKELGRKSSLVLQRLFEKAQEINGLSKADMDTIAGNSPETPEDSLPSGSSPELVGMPTQIIG